MGSAGGFIETQTVVTILAADIAARGLQFLLVHCVVQVGLSTAEKRVPMCCLFWAVGIFFKADAMGSFDGRLDTAVCGMESPSVE